MKIIGLDIGYGFLKISDKNKNILIPSVIGNSKVLTFEIKREDEKDIKKIELEYDNEKYFVGELAILQSDKPYRSLSVDRTTDITTKILFLTALALLTDGVAETFNVVTGLPVKDFLMYKNVYTDTFVGTYKLKINGVEKVIIVNKVTVVPQPYGTFCAGLFLEDGSVDIDYANNHIGIIDIGFKTSDFIQVKKFEYLDKFSSTSPNGISTIYTEVASYLNNNHSIFKEDYQLEDNIRDGQIKTRKGIIDLKPTINESKKNLARKIANEVKSSWTNFTEISLIIVTGGGGALIYNELVELLGDDIVIATEPQLENVIGYRDWGEYLESED